MSSIFPSKTDAFPTTANGDAVSANDWNRLVDALLSIQLTLGTNPEGTPLGGMTVPMTVRERFRYEMAWDSGIVETAGSVLATGVHVPFKHPFPNSSLVVLCTVQNLGIGESALSGTGHPGSIASGDGETDSADQLAGVIAWDIDKGDVATKEAGGFLMKGHKRVGTNWFEPTGAAVYKVAWIAMGMDTLKADAAP